METLWQDVKYGARMLLKNRTATLVAVLTLALGIGATTSIFTIANELLLRPRPGIGAPEELVDVTRSQDGRGSDNMSYPNYADFRDRNTSFSGVLGYRIDPRPVSMNLQGSAERVYAAIVSGNFFSVLQARPALGRFFVAEEDNLGDPRAVVVLSYAFWQQRFSGDPAMVGRELKFNGQSFAVVGVAAQGFRGTMIVAPDAWVPMATTPMVVPGSGDLRASRRGVSMIALGRLKPGVTLQRARAEAMAIGAQLEREYPNENRGKNFALYPSRLFPGELQNYIAGFLAVLMAIVGLILMIVCVNVAGILLVRATARRREMAVRLALGAGKARILRQLLTEGVLLFVLGGGAGLLVAAWMCDAILRMIPALPIPVSLELHMDWRVLSFALGVSLVSGVLSALAPALQVASPRIVTALKDDAQGASTRKLRLRNALVLGQVALSLVLLVCAGLFLRALSRANMLDPGFDVADVQTVELDFSLAGYTDETGPAFSRQLLERVSALPGVASAAYSWGLPLDGSGRSLGGVRVPGVDVPQGERFLEADWNIVTPGYFAALRIPIVRGRSFNEADRGSPRVIIVNETFANRFWPGQDAVGRKIETGDFSPMAGAGDVRTLEIVGVARDHKYRSLGDEQRLFLYVPHAQNYMGNVMLVARTQPGAPSVYPAIRSAVMELNPALPILNAQSLRDSAALGLLPQRIAGWLAGSLGSLGLLLTGIGMYGVMAFSVGQRTREIGIRMALGASERDILQMVIRAGFLLAAIGMAVGLVISLAAAPLLGSLLIDVSARDPITFIAVAMLMAAVAVLACYVPARRAMRVSPIAALRYE